MGNVYHVAKDGYDRERRILVLGGLAYKCFMQ